MVVVRLREYRSTSELLFSNFADTEPECEPPAKLVNLQCIDVTGVGDGTGDGGVDPTKAPAKRTYQGALEYCHVFEAKLPYTVVTGNQLYGQQAQQYNSLGRFKRSASYQITTPYGKFDLLQGDNAPDLFGYETIQNIKKRVCNITVSEDEVEVFSEEQDECGSKLESLIQLDDVEFDQRIVDWDLTKDEMNVLRSRDESLYNSFPVLRSGSGLDRWHWLDTPKRDDNKCLATIPGMIGKYRMFDCNADLRVICERRGSHPFPSQPPAIFNIPKTKPLPTVNSIQAPPANSFQGVGTSLQVSNGFQSSGFQTPAPPPTAPSIYDLATPLPTVPPPQNVPSITSSLDYDDNGFGNFVLPTYPTYNRFPRVNPTVGRSQLPKVNPYLRRHDQMAGLVRRNNLFVGGGYYKKR